ncbi:MAG: hypothetical protein AAFR90_05015 [Pseudomonadota bacterium]
MQSVFNRVDVSNTNVDIDKRHRNGPILQNPSGRGHIFQLTALHPLDRTQSRRRERGLLDKKFIFAGFAR